MADFSQITLVVMLTRRRRAPAYGDITIRPNQPWLREFPPFAVRVYGDSLKDFIGWFCSIVARRVGDRLVIEEFQPVVGSNECGGG